MQTYAGVGAAPIKARETVHHRVVIIGGGTGGITVAAQLARKGVRDIAIIEPSSKHYYQPLWTLVGAGVAKPEQSVRDEAQFIPKGARWIQDYAVEIDPDQQIVCTRNGTRVRYDFLVVAPGVVSEWSKIQGAEEALGHNSVSTNYSYELAPKTWEFIQQTKEGVALFTMPNNAEPGYTIKCGGAPQKIAYMAADYFRMHNRPVKVIYATAGNTIFTVPEFCKVLEGVCARYNIEVLTGHELVAVDPVRKVATFALKDKPGEVREIEFNMLHIGPPQRPPQFVRESPIAHQEGRFVGFVKVDIHTLQNPDYPNVFALGDASGLPTSRTGSAVRKQAPVLVHNLLRVMDGKEPDKHYGGYTACPIVTGYGRMVLAEFDYSGKPTPTIPFINTCKERFDMWLLKKYGLPWMYWNLMLRGLA
ncbi:MAG: NAD(P)/FAD-dependent oxidoreductase [Fimbriimonadales bacterium]|nr:NAD(P)/FAD-dependent oxidoreductase [Fimbriimonadales bacterium]MDW8051154.1 FAD/NAD(P)-binding oxidoreductase [Armatimonadota bacterium]